MTDQMPQVNAEFGTTPVIEFPTPEAPKGLKVVELTEGDGPIVRRGDTVTVNYHGVVWGKDTPFDSSFDRHQPASFGIGVGQVIKGWDQTVPGLLLGFGSNGLGLELGLGPYGISLGLQRLFARLDSRLTLGCDGGILCNRRAVMSVVMHRLFRVAGC